MLASIFGIYAILSVLWAIKNRLSTQEQNTQSRRSCRKALEKAYINGFYSNGKMAEDEVAINLKNLYTQYHSWGASSVFIYAVLKPLTKHPKAFHQLVNESWGATYYSPVFEAIHYWYCNGKAVRDLETFKPILLEDDMKDYLNKLVQYLFERYFVPEVMNEVWWTWNWYDAEEMSERTGYKEAAETMSFRRNVLFHWYFTLAEGNNLRHSPFLPITLSKQAAFWFSNAPDDLSLLQTFYWAKAKAKGLKEEIAKVVAQNSESLLDSPTLFDPICDCILKSKEEDNEKIKTFVQFVLMVRSGGASDEYAYFGTSLMPDLSLSGRTVASVLRLRQEFQRALGAVSKEANAPFAIWGMLNSREALPLSFLDEQYIIKPLIINEYTITYGLYDPNDVLIFKIDKKTKDSIWKDELMFRVKIYCMLSQRDFPKVQYLDDRFELKNDDKSFEIIRLSSYQDLVEEALLMEHCVAAYGAECNNGYTSIWSLRELDKQSNDKRLTTIQLTNYKIVQASGKLNEAPDQMIWDVMRTWKTEALSPYIVESEEECLIGQNAI
jgi:hypothetical protein